MLNFYVRFIVISLNLNKYNALFWIAIVGIGIIVLGMVGFLFFIVGDFSGPQKILLPDSEILQPVLESPEGKAFVARYPDYHAVVLLVQTLSSKG